MTLPTANVRHIHHLLAIHGQAAWLAMVESYGPNFLFQGRLITCDPVVVERLLMQRVHTRERPQLYKQGARFVPGAPGLLFLDGAEWEQQLRAVMPTFRPDHVDHYAQTMQQLVRNFTHTWQAGDHLPDLFTTLTELGMQVALSFGFGLDPAQPLAQRFGQALIDYKFATMRTPWRIDEFGFAWWKSWRIPFVLRDRQRLKRRMQEMQELVAALLQEAPQSHSRVVGERCHWLAGLAQAGLSLPVLTDALNHLYGAFNAIDFALTCAFVVLHKHPRWATILRQEYASVMGASVAGASVAGDGQAPTHTDFARLPQTMNFMRELLRCYPAAPVVARRTGEAMVVADNVIPAGSEAWILLHALHHHPAHWQDPAHFDPERWQRSSEPHTPYAYLPFLHGPRQCIGRHLAELHFVVVLQTLLRRFAIDLLTPNVHIPPYFVPRFAVDLPAVVRQPTEVGR